MLGFLQNRQVCYEILDLRAKFIKTPSNVQISSNSERKEKIPEIPFILRQKSEKSAIFK